MRDKKCYVVYKNIDTPYSLSIKKVEKVFLNEEKAGMFCDEIIKQLEKDDPYYEYTTFFVDDEEFCDD